LDRLQARERGRRRAAAAPPGRVLSLLRLLRGRGMLELGRRPPDTLAARPSAELRPLEAEDWPAVAEIYWDGMRDGMATFETEVPSWEVWDGVHLDHHRLVAEILGEVAGFAALSPISKRRCYLGVVENSVYVAREA